MKRKTEFGVLVLLASSTIFPTFAKSNLSSLPRLKQIKLTWFRNFEQRSFEFNTDLVGISGPNGIGKTNLLDAIYYLCYTKSYLQNKERNNIQQGKDGFRIEGNWQPLAPSEQASQTVCVYKEGKKSVLENEVPYQHNSEHIGKYTAVVIAPDDLNLINGGSDQRRKFVDGLLAQTDSRYLENLLGYNRVLKQKNTYLKQTSVGKINWPLIETYNHQLVQFGAYLIQERIKISEFLPGKVAEFYKTLCVEPGEIPSLNYQLSAFPDKLFQLFHDNGYLDLEYRRTPFGPHTEDWEFRIQDRPVKTMASQGQKKTFLISLKLAQMTWLQQTGKRPILLLDDIFEKLDRFRMKRLFELLPRFSLPQTFITHTEGEEMKALLKHYKEDFQIINLTR